MCDVTDDVITLDCDWLLKSIKCLKTVCVQTTCDSYYTFNKHGCILRKKEVGRHLFDIIYHKYLLISIFFGLYLYRKMSPCHAAPY